MTVDTNAIFEIEKIDVYPSMIELHSMDQGVIYIDVGEFEKIVNAYREEAEEQNWNGWVKI